MNIKLLMAGVLTLFVGWAHVSMGGVEIHDPVLASQVAKEVKTTMSVVWHWVTAMLLLNGLVLFRSALGAHNFSIVWLIAAQFFLFALLFIIYGLIFFQDLLVMPQWTMFLVIAGLSIWGIWGTGTKSYIEGDKG